MTRKPTDVVSPNLRIREDLRSRLEKEAKRRGVSLNQEMSWRLQRSFETDTAMSFDEGVSRLASLVARLDAREYEASKLGDLLNATEALVKQIDTLKQIDPKTEAATARVKAVIEMINIEAARAVRRARTTGEG